MTNSTITERIELNPKTTGKKLGMETMQALQEAQIKYTNQVTEVQAIDGQIIIHKQPEVIPEGVGELVHTLIDLANEYTNRNLKEVDVKSIRITPEALEVVYYDGWKEIDTSQATGDKVVVEAKPVSKKRQAKAKTKTKTRRM